MSIYKRQRKSDEPAPWNKKAEEEQIDEGEGGGGGRRVDRGKDEATQARMSTRMTRKR